MSWEIRDMRPDDVTEVQKIHEASGIDYALPDLSSPLCIIRKVVESNGKIIAAGAMKLEAELYVWVSHENGSPEERFLALKHMNDVAMEEAYWDKGLDQCVCWVPIKVEKSFAKRLKKLGFSRDREEFHTWSRSTKCS